jgi:hypothetical protein
MKIHPVGAELFNADCQTLTETDSQGDRYTEMTKLINAFHNLFTRLKMKLSTGN